MLTGRFKKKKFPSCEIITNTQNAARGSNSTQLLSVKGSWSLVHSFFSPFERPHIESNFTVYNVIITITQYHVLITILFKEIIIFHIFDRVSFHCVNTSIRAKWLPEAPTVCTLRVVIITMHHPYWLTQTRTVRVHQYNDGLG